MYSLSFLLLTAISLAAADKTGYMGTLSSLEGGLRGTVFVQDSNTLLIRNYRLSEADAPALYWWGSTSGSLGSGFRISRKQVTDASRGQDLLVPLDAGRSADNLITVGLWCERFGVSFGHTTLRPGNGGSSQGSASATASSGGAKGSAMATPTGTYAPVETGVSEVEEEQGSPKALKPVISDFYTTARVYFFSVMGLVLLESLEHFPIYVLVLFNRDWSHSHNSAGHSHAYLFLHKIFTLPSRFPSITNARLGRILRLTFFIALNILWGWNRLSYSTDFDLYGWLTLANGGLALLFGARNNIFATVARVPSDTLLMYHRWTGRATVVHVTIHFSALANSYVRSGQFTTVLQTLRIQVGLMAFVALWIMALTSFSLIRRRLFEFFYWPHALFILFVIGALIHARHAAEFLIPGLALYIIDRLIRFWHNFTQIETLAVTCYPGDLTKIKVRGLARHEPVQRAWVQIPEISFLNWHPFSIVSTTNDDEAIFAIRGLGGYTKKIQSLSSSSTLYPIDTLAPSDTALSPSPLLKLRVDGPNGVGSTQWGTHPLTVLVAGGIGVTPAISIATHTLQRAARHSRSQSFEKTSSMTTPKKRWHVCLLWAISSPSHARWFATELSSLLLLASSVPDDTLTFDLRIHVSNSGRKSSSASSGEEESSQDGGKLFASRSEDLTHFMYLGRPDLAAYFAGIRAAHKGLDAVVSVCGPRRLTTEVRRRAVEGQVRTGEGAYSVDEEVFEL